MKKRFSSQKKLKIFFLVIIACLLFGAVVMGLWNAILPEVLGVKSINFLQALGILLLSKILFGGFSRGCGGRGRTGWMAMQQKMAGMTPEEQETFKSEWRSRCGSRWKSEPSKNKSTE